MQILRPQKDVLASFENIVEPFFLGLNVCQQQIDYLQKMRDKLLPQLMSGKLEVKA